MRSGEIHRFRPQTVPNDPEIVRAIEANRPGWTWSPTHAEPAVNTVRSEPFRCGARHRSRCSGTTGTSV